MKLRNKLAAVLATAMVVTSVPVVTMAASGNTLSTSKLTVAEKGTKWEDATTAPALQVEFKSKTNAQIQANPEVFYLKLDNASWLEDDMEGLSITGGVEFDVQSYNIVKVTVTDLSLTTGSALWVNGTSKVNLPLLAEVTKKGDVSLELTAGGSGSTITEGSWVIAATSDKVGTATVGAAKTFNKSGKIAAITLKEAYKGSFKASGHNYAMIELNDSDYEFELGSPASVGTYYLTKSGNTYSFSTSGSGTKYNQYTVAAEYLYGFGNVRATDITVYAPAGDKDTLYVELPNNISSDSIGQIKLKDLEIKNTVKNPSQGDVTVNIKGNIEALNKAVVAKVGNYDAIVKLAEEDEKVEILAGQSEEVNFVIEEGVVDTFTEGREMDVTIKNGYFIDAVLDADKEVDDAATLRALQDAITELEYTVDGDDEDAMSATTVITDYEVDSDNRVIAFTLKPDVATFDQDDVNGFRIKMDVNTRLTDSGDVTISVESRDLDETVTGTIATVKTALKVESEAAVLKVGLKNQVAGKLTITEVAPEFLQKGEDLVIYLPKIATGISIDQDNLPTVKVTSGDVKLGDVKYKTGEYNKDGDRVAALVIPVKQASTEAATIEVSDFTFDVDRTAPQGACDIYVGGKAVSSAETTVTTSSSYKYLNQAITAEDFIVIGTANTEDLTASNGLAKGTATFAIGEAKYTVNGVEKTMDAQSYIQDPGYTMIPVRYVAEAFGVAQSDILFSKGVVTIFAGSRTIQLTSGSDVAVVNGAQVTMGTKVVIKNGRTYAPVGEIARILGISTDWDGTSKVATFENK